MKRLKTTHILACMFLGLGIVVASPAMGAEALTVEYQILGIEYETGNVYGVSALDASLTYLGTTGLAGFGSLEFAPDGALYGFTTGFDPDPKLYEIDPVDFTTTEIGELGLDFVFDGALVFAPDGIVYGINRGAVAAPELFTLDMGTGEATPVATIDLGGATRHDINSMAWRDDGMLVGVDRIANALLEIDPADGTASVIAYLTPDAGGVGGMAVWGDVGYFATGGPDAAPGGSNELYTFDLYTGQHTWVGSFDGTITEGSGIAGLAIVPEPASLLLLAAGGLALSRRRR